MPSFGEQRTIVKRMLCISDCRSWHCGEPAWTVLCWAWPPRFSQDTQDSRGTCTSEPWPQRQRVPSSQPKMLQESQETELPSPTWKIPKTSLFWPPKGWIPLEWSECSSVTKLDPLPSLKYCKVMIKLLLSQKRLKSKSHQHFGLEVCVGTEEA
jgi:hypothetical protein